uniref:Uncharacterized protein n=1 Tax=Medicago truncatula TaxID=3880 RepID=I3T8G6_MEDTR|nr:unknown [Medicago truncatula]
MASLQHTTASIYSKSIPKTTTTLTPKPILNLILSRTTFTSPKLKLSKTKPRQLRQRISRFSQIQQHPRRHHCRHRQNRRTLHRPQGVRLFL